MSSIFKLSIQGIRSYESRTTIQFATPLTVIVGQNGTGKTTIIECLRYATTGDLPPNSKGGAFIHDPKLSGEREVLGQIKLAFVNANGKEMVCTRSMQLQMKRSAMTFKTLDGNLVVVDRDTDKRESVGSKCADLDSLMPVYLGASRAVLDYVIFCHQEDSMWPLAEPSLVKKRFDEIFEATKFSKMLEDIKTIKKDIGVDIKLQKQTTMHLKMDSERAGKARTRLAELQQETETFQEEASQLQIEIEEVTSKSKKLFETSQKFQGVIYKLRNLRESLKSTEQTTSKLIESIDSDVNNKYLKDLDVTEIEQKLTDFEPEARRRKAIIGELNQQNEEKRKDLEEIRLKQSQQTLQEGKLKAESEAFSSALEQKSELIELVKNKFQLTENDIRKVHDELESASNEMKNDIEKEKNIGRNEENGIFKEIHTLSAEKLHLEQSKSTKNESLKEFEQKITILQSEIDNMNVDEGVLQYEKSELTHLINSADKIRKDIQLQTEESELENNKEKVRVLEDQLEEQNLLLEKTSRHATEFAQLEVLKIDYEKKKSALDALLEGNKSIIEKLVGTEYDINELDNLFRSILQSLQSALDEEQTNFTLKSNSSSEYSALLNAAKIEISENKQELKNLIEELEKLVPEFDPTQYQEEMEQLEMDLASAVKNLEQATFTADYYRTAIEFASDKKEHKCLLCRRPFEDYQKAEKFIETLEKFITKLPMTPEDATIEHDEIKADMDKMKGLSSKVTRLLELKDTEIPKVQDSIELYEEELKNAKKEQEIAQNSVRTARLKLNDTSTLRKTIGDITRLSREAETLKKQIEERETGKMFSSEQIPSNIHKKINQIKNNLRSLKMDIDTKSESLSSLQADLNGLETRMNNQRLKINEKENEFSRKQAKASEVKELREKIETYGLSIQEIDEKLDILKTKLEHFEEELSETRIKYAAREQELHNKMAEIRDNLSKLKELISILEKYESINPEDQLLVCRSKLKELEIDSNELMNEINAIEMKIRSEEKSLVDVNGYERALKDCLELDSLNKKTKEITISINELEAENADNDMDKYEEESRRLQEKLSELTSAYSGRLGEIKQMQDQAKRLETELDTEYKDIDEQLREAGSRLDVQQHTDNDLVGWGRAVDRAMMSFHKVNMERINEIIATLWTEAYTGTDVETILIRADSEKTSGTGRAMYNYRVCMVKQGVELDMRGRCSAGQKVLACIVIRLALAQCFGTRCGVITLDEPTTSLDAGNIAALANSLTSLIKSRLAQQNFQLVIITHDEQFLQQMHASNYTDHFFRVSRDENQESRISLHHISQITSD